jgi:hypothetical protein
LVGDYTAALEGEALAVDASHLCDIERDQFIFEIDLTSNQANTSLEAYYEAANPELVRHLSSIATAFAAGESHARVTYVRGAAGIGKSFVTRNLTSAFDTAQQCSIEMADLFAGAANSLGFPVELAADLTTQDRETVFNRLPAVADEASFDLKRMLDAAGCVVDEQLLPLIILDGIDELHGNTSTLMLEAVDDFIRSGAPGAGRFVHFFISGRPEGFATWLNHPHRKETNTAIVDQFDLQAPRYGTAGDLEYRVRGYLDFARDPPLAADEIAAHVKSFTEAVSKYPFLSYSIGNLALGNIAIEQTAPSLSVSEQSLKEGLFDDILLRNAGTHGRPGADSDLEGTYRRALEDVATKYAEVADDGRFAVRSEDTIEAFDDAGRSLGTLRVRNLLGRAGVAFLTEPSTSTTRYRFDPYWLHAHLIERRNTRTLSGYVYRPCE